MTRDEAAIITAYTGVITGSFSDFHAYVEKIMGRPVWTHEMASLADELKERAKPDFIAICASIQ